MPIHKKPQFGGDDESDFDDKIEQASDIDEPEETFSETSEDLTDIEEVDEEKEIASEDEAPVKAEVPDTQSCLYKIKQKKKVTVENSIDALFLESETPSVNKVVNPEDRITKPILFKYERVRILGDRCSQITHGAKPMIKNFAGLSPREIVDLELKHGVIPFIIVRKLPSGNIEHWKISELQIVN